MSYLFHDVEHHTLVEAVTAALLDWYTFDGGVDAPDALAEIQADAGLAWHELLARMADGHCELTEPWTRDVDWGTYRAARNAVLAKFAKGEMT